MDNTNIQNKKLFWGDEYYFPQVADMLFSNFVFFTIGVLLFIFFMKTGFGALGSLIIKIISRPFNLTILFAVALGILLFIILVFSIWSILIVVRTISYVIKSQSLAIYEEGIFLGKDSILFSSKLDKFLFTSSDSSFLGKIFFFRGILRYPFFKVKNKKTIFLNFDEIKQISIIKDRVFRSILRYRRSSKEDVYYLKIIRNNGEFLEKEIKNVYGFMRSGCLGFLSSKSQLPIDVPEEFQNKKLFKFEHVVNIITAVVLLIILVFFILAYIEYYGKININPFI